MSNTPFGEGGGDNEEWVENMMEAMLITKALDQGGVISMRRDKVIEAADRAKRWFPNGMHAHWEQGPDGYRLELVDRSKCDKEGDDAHEAPKGSMTWGDLETQFDGASPLGMAPGELERLTHAQHILITVLMARLGLETINTDKDEYTKAAGLDTSEMGAVIISRKGDNVACTFVKDASKLPSGMLREQGRKVQ